MATIALKAETAGVVWQVTKQVGDTVDVDEPVVIIESMKMEIPVCASNAGRLVELCVAEGDAVAEDQTVALLATD